MPQSRQGGVYQRGAGFTCPILHILHFHDFSVDPTPEDVQGAIDGLGPLGRFLAPSDPERQQKLASPIRDSNTDGHPGTERSSGLG